MRVVSRMFDSGHKPTFVDVGCGIGVKLLLAREFLYSSKIIGIEIHPKYSTVAERLITCPRIRDTNTTIIEADAIKHNYKPYDIIYFYRPLSIEAKQIALETQILKTARPGTLITANGRSQANNEWSLHTEHVWGNVIFKRRPVGRRVPKRSYTKEASA